MQDKMINALCGTRKKQLSLAAIIIAIWLLMFPRLLTIPVVDTQTQRYFTHSIKEAAEVYLTCRIIIGTLGLLEHSQVSLRPFGVGVQTEPGQMLDPVYDMAERASDVMVTCIASLTVEEIGYEITCAFAPYLLAILLLSLAALAYGGFGREHLIFRRIAGLTLILLSLRVALPISALVNIEIHQHFFAARIAQARNQIDIFPPQDIQTLTSFKMPRMTGVFSDLTAPFEFVKQKTVAMGELVDMAIRHAGSLSQSFVDLCALYVGEFVIQVVILPLLAWWVLVRIANAAMEANLPVIIRHNTRGKTSSASPADNPRQ
ncbi:MAG: hypothetical protein ACP5O1_08950 [Phycisphaerae bacterium]